VGVQFPSKAFLSHGDHYVLIVLFLHHLCRLATESATKFRVGEDAMTLEDLEDKLPNGFHDAEIFSFELDYPAGIATFRMNLLVGWPDDPEPERQAYQKATLVVTGLCFCSIDAPSSTYPFLPDGKPICVSGDAAKSDHLPSLSDLLAKLPSSAWCYRFFVDDWNAFIHVAGRDAELSWVGDKPKHAL
jgi:hypothetical protein